MTDARFRELWAYAKKRERLDEGSALTEALRALVEKQAEVLQIYHLEDCTEYHRNKCECCKRDLQGWIAARCRELGLENP